VLNIIDALIADGKLTTTGGNRPKVNLPDQPLTPQPAEAKQNDPEQTDSTSLSISNPPISNLALVNTLRAWRTDQAKEQGVPSYVVFSNKVLEVIAAKQPATLSELGVG